MWIMVRFCGRLGEPYQKFPMFEDMIGRAAFT